MSKTGAKGAGCFAAAASAAFVLLLGASGLTFLRLQNASAEPAQSRPRESSTDLESEPDKPVRRSRTDNPWVHAENCARHLKARELADARRECRAGLGVAKAVDANRDLHLLLGMVAEAEANPRLAEEEFLNALSWSYDPRLPIALRRVGPRAVTQVQKWATVKLPPAARNGTVRKLPWKTADEVTGLDAGTRVYVEVSVTTGTEGTWFAVRREPTDPPLGWMHRGITDL